MAAENTWTMQMILRFSLRADAGYSGGGSDRATTSAPFVIDVAVGFLVPIGDGLRGDVLGFSLLDEEHGSHVFEVGRERRQAIDDVLEDPVRPSRVVLLVVELSLEMLGARLLEHRLRGARRRPTNRRCGA